jgi:hypothetical protein
MHDVLLNATKWGLLFGEHKQVNMIKKKLEYSIGICTKYCMTLKNISKDEK